MFQPSSIYVLPRSLNFWASVAQSQTNAPPQDAVPSKLIIGIGVLIFLLVILLFLALRKNQVWSFRFTVLLCFGVGIILLSVQIPLLETAFTHSFGDALIIASILAVTVDAYLKQRVLREVSSDVSKYLIGYRLPTEVQDRIRALLQTRWIRRNCTVRLRLSEVQGKAGYLRKEIVISKDMENITTEEASFQDRFTYERHQPETIQEMRCDSADAKAQYLIRGAGLAQEKADEPGVMEALGKLVKIPPVVEVPGINYRFTVRYEAEHPDNYSDILSFDIPTLGVIFEAECPANVRVSAAPADVITPNRWEYRRLFLPGEHIRFRWERNFVEEPH